MSLHSMGTISPPVPNCKHALYIRPELVENIAKEVRNEGISLKSFILVCREWARIAYPYHFSSLRYCASLSVPLYGEPFTTTPHRVECCSFDDLRRFLECAPMLCESVRALQLDGYNDEETAAFLDLIVLSAILELLPNLQSLRLLVPSFACHSSWTTADHLLEPTQIHLDQLLFESPLMCTSTNMISLLSLFSSVRQVEFEEMYISGGEAEATPEAVPRPATRFPIESIRVLPSYSSAFKDWLVSFIPLIDPTALKSLKVATPCRDDMDVTAQLIRAVGTHLRDFSFEWLDHPELLSHLDLSCCINLRCLDITVWMRCFDIHTVEYEAFMTGSWPCALRTLERASPTVQTMTVGIWVDPDGDYVNTEELRLGIQRHIPLFELIDRFQALDWSLLDSAIRGHRELREVIVHVQLNGILRAEDTEEFATLVKAILVTNPCFGTPARRTLLRVKLS